ncbi:hypothetical protein J0H58_33665, partial [bacterium]|nr:hypothetical protein [bacterium]
MPEPSLPRPVPQDSRFGARVDVVLVALAVAVAGLAASFVARNSDLWLHLAAGRLVAAGEYRFGADPFAVTDQYWANHAWLFDLGLYLVFHHLGPAAVGALKAAAAAGTAALMLATARRAPVWLAALCVLLAATAMAPRLLLQPAVASYLLLAACLYCLHAGGRALRLVPLLIALWVNLDGWFLLGPLLVGLFALGRDRHPWPKWFVPAALAACLLSPHHVHALAVPPELSLDVWASDFPTDPRLAGVFAAPWHAAPLGAAGGYNLAAWAFVVLLALGAASFAVNRRAARTWRGPVWLAFALLAAWQVRLVPFFAVVAGPVTALNLGDVLPPGALARTGRGVVLLVGAALAALGWYGKLTGFHGRDRGAAWGVHTDPTLERTATAVAGWRACAPDAKLFTAHPDVGHYLAWFAPGVRSSIDSRLTLFASTSGEYRGLSRALGLLPDEDAGRGREPFVERGVAAVVVYDPDARRMTGAVRELAAGPWDVVAVTGAVLAVPKGGPSPAPRFDPERAAFGPAADAAEAGPAALPEARLWWEGPRETGRRGSWEADAAAVYLRLAEASPDRSPALPLLALRAARRGAELDPADPAAWLVAARAAMILGSRT